MTNLYYDNPKFDIGNPNYYLYICEGMRGRGKTTLWLNRLCKRAITENKKFLYLRRSEKEMELAIETGLFNACRTVPEYKDFWEEYPSDAYKNGRIYLINKNGDFVDIGYTHTLNNVKGISVEDCDVCLFDEYVAETRGKYKGGDSGLNEPTLFFRLLETIFRRRKFWVVMLGNQDTPSNPYNETLHIPFGAPFYKDKSRGLWYEFDYSEDTKVVKEQTVLGIITKGTRYNAYSMGEKALGEIEDCLISDKPSHAIQVYNIKIFGNLLTIWRDESKGVLYTTSKCRYNPQVPTISVTNADMSVDTNFIRYNSDFNMFMKAFFGSGRMRFDSQKTGSLFATMLSIS